MKDELNIVLNELERLGKSSDEVVFWRKTIVLMDEEEMRALLSVFKKEVVILLK